MKALDWFRSTSFYKSWLAVKNNQKAFWLTLLFDVLFIASTYILSKIYGYITPGLAGLVRGSQAIGWSVGILYMLLYIGTTILIYSAFKYSILNEISGLFKKKLEKIHFKQFFYLNLLLALFGILGYALLNIIMAQFERGLVISVLMLLILVLAGVMMYSFMNLAQVSFVRNKRALLSFKEGFMQTFKFRQWPSVMLGTIVLFLVFNIAYYLFALALKGVIAKYYGIYIDIFTMINITFAYLINAFNRFHFYLKSK